MKARWIVCVSLSGLAAFGSLYALQPQANQSKPTPGSVSEKSVPAVHESDGAKIFDANCARCHQTPTGFSPNIAGTVVRHMRVRANLSAHDERELIRYLNP
jgi:cytochrome c5